MLCRPRVVIQTPNWSQNHDRRQPIGGKNFKPHRARLTRPAPASPGGAGFLAVALVLLLGLIFNGDGAFFKIGTHRDALRQMSVYGILACGLTPVIITGGIDLAVGSLLALVAVCAAKMAIHWNWPGALT